MCSLVVVTKIRNVSKRVRKKMHFQLLKLKKEQKKWLGRLKVLKSLEKSKKRDAMFEFVLLKRIK